MTTLELIEARKDFTDASVNASLRVESGTQLVLLGPSGCGKTTVLRMIAGLTQPDSGDIRFDDESVLGTKPEDRDAVMVFQAHALFPFRTVLENIAYGLKVRKVEKAERERRARAALRSVQLHGYEERWPDELSGGERQRVALARSIVVEPRVMLLDEPLSSLDPVLRNELQQLVLRVQRERQITSVFVTHDRDEARAVGHQIAVMLQGVIHQVGTPDDVFAHPVSDEVSRFLGSATDGTDATERVGSP